MITSILANPVYSAILTLLTALGAILPAIYINYHEDALIKNPAVYRNLVILCAVPAILNIAIMFVK